MSARSSRSELFSSRSGDIKSNNNNNQNNQQILQQQHNDDNNIIYGNEDDPLQLEHIIGYAGDYRHTIKTLPQNENIYLKSMGNLVSYNNLTDPHDQQLLRGHDMPVCAITISCNGTFIASGQLGTKQFKGSAAPIFVWNTATYQRVKVLRGLTIKVNVIAFSTDERMVSACGEDGLMYIWDVSTGEVIYGNKAATPISVLKWVDHNRKDYYTDYELVVCIGSEVKQAFLTFLQDRVQWDLKMYNYTMPTGGGLIRTFTSVDVANDKNGVYIGTTGGEMMIFRRDTRVFRACIPICTNGVQALSTLPNGDVICGGGDGTLTVLSGRDMVWNLMGKKNVDSAVKAISVSANMSEVIVGCSSGSVYRCLIEDLTTNLIGVGHTSPITCITFGSLHQVGGSLPSTCFLTGSKDSMLRLWDVADYACIDSVRYPTSGSVLSILLFDNNKLVLSGWDDGFIRCNDANKLNTLLWYIPVAHRNGTTSLTVYRDSQLEFFVSGGNDGTIRVWRLSNRELVTQYTEHTKGIVKAIVDIQKPNIIHSVGTDCTILSYDLKAARRIICHMVTSGGMTDVSQRKDSELELVTCDIMGRLLSWDIDARDPVMAVQDPSREALRSLSVSPSGRFLAFAGDDFLLKVLDIVSGQVISVGQGHSNVIRTVVWTPDEKQILTGSDDTCICIWNFFLGDYDGSKEGKK